ncbi:MAG: two-component regulator propeller domain-containing protein [Candidatus Latescibacterota bacterium]
MAIHRVLCLASGQSTCDVYLDVAHHESTSPAVQYVRLGAQLQVYGAGAQPEDVRVGVRRAPHRYVYEWRIDAGRPSGGAARLAPGMVIGLDVVVNDPDADGQYSWMSWGTGTSKVNVTGNRGDAVLVGEGAGTGTLRVRATPEGGTAPAANRKVRVHFAEPVGQWVDLVTDREGLVSTELPAAQYRLLAGARGAPGEGVPAVVRAGEALEVPLEVPPCRGVSVTAGKGKVVRSGPGTRQGPWLTYDASDGLPSALVRGICRDGQGGLWLGTLAGAVHFDGGRFRILGTEDGLPSAEVLSIAQDRHRNLWLGFWQSGLARYDGQTVTTFTTEDGLAGNSVRAMLEDRQGNLWFGTDEGGVSQYDGKEFTTYTLADGLTGSPVQAMYEDRQGGLWVASSLGASRYDGSRFTPFTAADGLASNDVIGIAEDRQGALWFATWNRGASRHDGRGFTTFRAADGLVGDDLRCAAADGEGNVWLGSGTGGVSRWDGQRFSTFTARDGLTAAGVHAIAPDGQGGLWFGSQGGLSRYDGAWIASFTAADGLARELTHSPLLDRQGDLWFASGTGVTRYDGARFATLVAGKELPGRYVGSMLADARGDVWVSSAIPGNWVSRYDGEELKTYPVDEQQGEVSAVLRDHRGTVWFASWEGGLSRLDGQRVETVRPGTSTGTWVNALVEDRDGNLWLGAYGGLWRYDGNAFASFTTGDGLASDSVNVIHQDRRGALWVGASRGLSRFDGSRFTTFTTRDGLAGNGVRAIVEDRQGILWMATDGGVTRYDGKAFTSFTALDGLVHNDVLGILEDRDGHLWFHTPGGVSRYDGRVFQRLRREDGLVHNYATGMVQDRAGDVWITTLAGVTRYRSRSEPPRIEVTDVVADRRHGPVAELRLSSSQELVAFEFQGASLSTGPGQMAYLYRLQGRDPDWRVTRASRVEFGDLPIGQYTFEVLAVDRDLVYSEQAAAVRLRVHPPYATLALAGGLGLALIGLAGASVGLLRRRRAQRRAEQALLHEQQARLQAQEALSRELESELQTAHDLQMGLMPVAAPTLRGMTVAGRCVTANHVGGDFYAYFGQDEAFTVALADVTGHAMDAAIPAVMFSGILDKQMEMPLALAPGDCLVFHSDGFAEATNRAGECFGYARTIEAVRRACAEGLEPQALIERLIAAVRQFAGDAPQGDDMTCVVLKVCGTE